MSEEIASQSEESQEIERDADTEALYDSFGMTQTAPKNDVNFPTMDEPADPAIDQEDEFNEEEIEQKQSDTRKFKVKYNKEEIEIDESQVPDLLEKGMALDKTRAKLNEQQKAMDELAQLQGYKDHAELLAKLPELRAQKEQKEQNAYNETRQRVIDDLVYNGVSQEDAEAYADNNPYVKEAQRAIAERDASKAQNDSAKYQETIKSQWDEVFTAFPDIDKRDLAFNGTQVEFVGDKAPDWLTPEVISKLERGYSPLDAVTLSNMDKIQAQSKKSSQQQLIKQQQLGMRGHVNEQTATPPDEGSLLPVHYGLAEEFGVSLKGIQAQNKLIKNRR